MSKVDIFDVTFEILQQNLALARNHHANDPNQHQIHQATKQVFESIVFEQITEKLNRLVEEVGDVKEILLKKYLITLEYKRTAIKQIEGSVRTHLASCYQFEQFVKQRLNLQQQQADARVRDLIFEIIGEYGKSHLRMIRRQEFLLRSGQYKEIIATWKLLWQRFTLRLKFELFQSMLSSQQMKSYDPITTPNLIKNLRNSQIRCVHLLPERDSEEIQYVINKASKRVSLLTDEQFAVLSIIKMSKTGREKTGANLPSITHQHYGLVNRMKELKELIEVITLWANSGVLLGPNSPERGQMQQGSSRSSRSASGTRSANGRRRDTQQKKASIDASAPQLKEFLSSSWIQWIHPASHCHQLWDKISTLYSKQGNAANKHENGLVEFARRFHGQHSATVFNDRLYFCLEERSLSLLAGGTGDDGSLLHGGNSSAAYLARQWDAAVSNNTTDKRVAVENATTMLLLSTLQEVYTAFPNTYTDHFSKSIRTSSASSSLAIVQKILRDEPLTVTGFDSTHRFLVPIAQASNAQKYVQVCLSFFPDIVQVRSPNGTVLHFCPAILGNLPETRAWSCCNPSSDDIRSAAARCPHPDLSKLHTSTHPYLGTLYTCIIPSTGSDDSRDNNAAISQTNGVRLNLSGQCREKDEFIHPSIQQQGSETHQMKMHLQRHSGTSAAPSAGAITVNTKGPSKLITNVLPPSPMYILPLANESMQILFAHYLWPISSGTKPAGQLDMNDFTGIAMERQYSDDQSQICVGDDGDREHFGRSIFPSSLSLLPDHARCRLTSTSLSPRRLDSEGESPGSKEERDIGNKILGNKYLLLPDERPAESNGTRSAAGDSGKANALTQTYYLVQLHPITAELQARKPSRPAGTASAIDEDDEYEDDFIEEEKIYTKSSGRVNGLPAGAHSYEDDQELFNKDQERLAKIIIDHHRSLMGNNMIVPIQNNDAAIILSGSADAGNDSKEKRKSRRKSGASSKNTDLDDVLEADAVYDTEIRSTTSGGNRKKWDPTVLSNVCRWRSCVCDSTSTSVGTSKSKYKQLCLYHAELKEFLDAKGSERKQSSQLESAKYLPRKVPNITSDTSGGALGEIMNKEQKRDWQMIRAASTLLQELWDGKLRNTVKSFSKKVMRDMSCRTFLESALPVMLASYPAYKRYGFFITTSGADEGGNGRSKRSSGMVKGPVPGNNVFSLTYFRDLKSNTGNSISLLPSRPTWAIWKNQKYCDKTIEGQASAMGILDGILLTEKAISRELQGFLQMRAFPSSELAIIRKEVKAFKEHQELVLQSRSDQMGGGVKDIKLLSMMVAASGSQSTAELKPINEYPSPSKDMNSSEGDLAALIGGYDDLVNLLTAENRMCEKKLMMFGNRRQEEEDRRIAYMKKMARAKAIQDAQERDPANFKNQRNF